MEDLHFKSQQHFDAFLTNLKFIGGGSEGECYRLGNDRVLKYLNGPNYEPLDKGEILQFSHVNISNYIFVQNIVYLQEQIIGVLMKYIDGESIFDRRLYKTQYDSIISAFEDLEQATRRLSALYINVFDAYSTNVIYKDRKFYMIDTMGYKFEEKAQRFSKKRGKQKTSRSEEEIYRNNISSLSFHIYDCILTRAIKKYLHSIKGMESYEKEKYFLENPAMFLKIVRSKLSEYCDTEIKTVDQAEKILKKIR